LRGPPQTGGKRRSPIYLLPRLRPSEIGSDLAHRPRGRVLSHACSLRLRRALAARQPIAGPGSRTTRTTVVTEDPGTDEVTTSARAPHRASSSAAVSISTGADEPFIASSCPPSPTSGIPHASS